MRIFIRMLVIVAVAWWMRPQADPEDIAATWQGIAQLVGTGAWLVPVLKASVLGLALLLLWAGGFVRGFWSLVGGVLGGLLLTGLAASSSTWGALSPLPAWLAPALFFALVVAVVYLVMAPLPGFRSGKLRLRDGGDHLSVETEYGTPELFMRGRVLCTRKLDGRSETRTGGGARIVPTTAHVTTYGPGGSVGYGTVYGSQVVSAPVYTYDKWIPSGSWSYTLTEAGVDHALLLAARPSGVDIVARHDLHYHGTSKSFVLNRWGAFRFEAWRRLHGRLFFRPDQGMPKRIARAVSAHKAAMKKLHGKTRVQHLVLDHELALESFVGLGKDRVVVHVPDQDVSAVIASAEVGQHLSDRGELTVPGIYGAVTTGQKIRNELGKWAKLHALRGQKA